VPDAPAPAGIGNCSKCPYLETGTAAICYRCARDTIEPLADFHRRCAVCDLPLKQDGSCGNPLCSWDDRGFDWNFAIAMRSGVLETAINAFKYEGRWGWRSIFGRVLVGFLDEESRNFEDFDLIVASPTYLEVGGDRQYDHTREVIRAAAEEAGDRWPFDIADPPAIVKTEATTRFVGKRWRGRKELAETELRHALSIPDRARTEGKDILVYDDVFTDGFTLREVALCLRNEGRAARVCGVSLSRQPFRG
jgi:predicted amidophosphoribosyltransferase